MNSDQLRLENSPAVDLSADALILPIPGDRLSESDSLEGIFEAAGSEVLSSVTTDLPLRPGNVSVTSGGALAYDRIVHIPVQSAPGVPTTEENFQVGLRSGLVAADEEGTASVVLGNLIPPDQTDVMDFDSVAEVLVQDLLQYPPAHFTEFTIASSNDEWIESVRTHLQ